MALFGISKDELRKQVREARDDAYESGYKDGENDAQLFIGELETSVERKNKEIKKLQRQLEDRNEEIEVLTKNKTDARKLVEERLENENTSAELSARQSRIYKREEALDKREEELNTRVAAEDDKRYKEGYADGVSDGVRKISEITAEDRKNAMDVAMVSAASHTQPEVVKAVLDGNKEIKTSLSNKKAK